VRSVVRIYPGPPLPLRGCSSAGRAPALQAGGHRFDPGQLHQVLFGLYPPSRPIQISPSANFLRNSQEICHPERSRGTCGSTLALNKLELFKAEHPKRMLTFEQRRKAKLFDPPQGGHRINLRCNWMFDNEIDWVKKITRLSRSIPE
jgi:hypothetical protein